MMGDKRLRTFRDPGEITNAQLARFEQRRRQHQPSRIRQGARLPRRDISLLWREPLLAQPLGDLQVEAEQVAAIIDHANILTFVPTS